MQTWLAARYFLLERSADFYTQLTLARETFNPEAIHDLRVSSRRLREGIAIFADCFGKSQLAPIRKELQALTAMLGSIRNTDEAILFFSPLLKQCAAEAAAAVTNIVATLKKQRVAEQRKLKRELEKIDPGLLPGRIARICSKPRIFKPASNALLVPVATTILDAVAVREKTVLELLPEALIEANVTAQHRLRVAVKRFRYRMELLAPFAGRDYKAVYSTIKGYQEILGHMHDLDVFICLTAEPANGPQQNSSLSNIIIARRKVLFNEFTRLHEANPLYKMGDLVRGLL